MPSSDKDKSSESPKKAKLADVAKIAGVSLATAADQRDKRSRNIVREIMGDAERIICGRLRNMVS